MILNTLKREPILLQYSNRFSVRGQVLRRRLFMRGFTREELCLVLSLYSRWNGMFTRCYNKNDKNYPNYGERGIEVCKEWIGKEGFLNFFEYVSQLPHFGEEGYSLDRINVNGNYEPSNVQWATYKKQGRNRRTNVIVEDLEGNKITLVEASEKYNLSYKFLKKRHQYGKSGEELLSPVVDKKIRIDGKTFRELSEETGIAIETLRHRYKKGDRGEKLLRPLEKNKVRNR